MSIQSLKRLLTATLLLLIAFQVVTAQGKTKSSPGSVTGTYSLKRGTMENSLDAQLLPKGKVKIYLYASWIGSVALGNVHIGEIKATLPIKNRVAVYESGQCRITIRFTGRRALVTQSGSDSDCDFGMNVSAEGTYTKRSSRRPKFDF